MKINGVEYVTVDLSATSLKGNAEIRYKKTDKVEYVAFSGELLKMFGEKRNCELMQSKDMKSFVLLPLDKQSEHSISFPKNNKTCSKTNKKVLELFRIFSEKTGRSNFEGKKQTMSSIFL